MCHKSQINDLLAAVRRLSLPTLRDICRGLSRRQDRREGLSRKQAAHKKDKHTVGMSQQQQQQSAIDGCFREMRHPRPSPKKQKPKERKKELTKKERKLQYSLFDIFSPNCEEEGEGDKSAGAQDYKIRNLRRGHNRKYKSFRFITSTPNAHLVVTEAESRGDHKGTSGHLERLLPGTSRRANPLARAGCRILLEGRLPNAGCVK